MTYHTNHMSLAVHITYRRLALKPLGWEPSSYHNLLYDSVLLRLLSSIPGTPVPVAVLTKLTVLLYIVPVLPYLL